MLSRFPGATAVIGRMVNDWSRVPLPPIVLFKSQVGGDDSSRPDLEAHSATGEPVAIFESKFWAGLTDAQPDAYLRRLAQRGGILCFVAPSSRLRVLWTELRERAALSGTVVDVSNESEVKLAHVGPTVSLVLISWQFLLLRVRDALEAAGETGLVSDVRQLLSLTARFDA